MATTIGRWNGFKFTISPSIIRGFTGLTIKGSSETKDKKKSKQTYVKRKSGKPSEVSLTVVLNSALGCDVRTDALKLVSYATAGKTDYFYVGNKKLLSCKLMLVDASVKEADVGDGNTWINAEVQLTMKQSSKGSTSSTSSSSKKSSKKKSVKKSSSKKSTKSTKKSTGSSSGVDAITGAAPSAAKLKAQVAQTTKKVVSSAVQTIKKITTAAKKVTTAKKVTPKVTKPSSRMLTK